MKPKNDEPGQYGTGHSNLISISSSSAPVLEAVLPLFGWWKGIPGCGHGDGPTVDTPSLPRTSWSIHRWFWRPSLACGASSTCASSGTSPFCTAVRWVADRLLTPALCFDLRTRFGTHGSWTGLADWKAEMPRHYADRIADAGRNAEQDPRTGGSSSEESCRRCWNRTTRSTGPVSAIFQSPEGEPGDKTFPDPFFGGEGPARTTCTGCGGCMMGCRHGAKNTLDHNYLYLAEKRGARFSPRQEWWM